MTLPSPPQLQEFCSFPLSSKAEAVMSQEHKGAVAVRESRKHQETCDRTVRTGMWCMAKYPNPQSRRENLSLKPPICEFWETNRFYL